MERERPAETSTANNELLLIYIAKYSKLKMIMSLILIIPLPLYLMMQVSYVNYIENDYVYFVCFLLLSFLLIVIAVDSLLFNTLAFYKDRVVKTWFFLGSVNIYYSRAKVIDPPSCLKFFSSAHQIRKTDDSGKTLLRQIPIFYMSFFFNAKDKRIIENIMDYLTGDKQNNPRVFKQSILHKEVVCQ